MIKNRQKFLLHEYKRAAHLSDPDYRDILKRYASVTSAADKRMKQSGFEAAMAALETRLFLRVASGEIPNPIRHSKYIKSESFWRDKLPDKNVINSRQARKITDLWERLQEYIPPECRNMKYLGGILYHATGRRDVGYYALSHHEASHLIDALKDRLAHALKQQPTQQKEIPC